MLLIVVFEKRQWLVVNSLLLPMRRRKVGFKLWRKTRTRVSGGVCTARRARMTGEGSVVGLKGALARNSFAACRTAGSERFIGGTLTLGPGFRSDVGATELTAHADGCHGGPTSENSILGRSVSSGGVAWYCEELHGRDRHAPRAFNDQNWHPGEQRLRPNAMAKPFGASSGHSLGGLRRVSE